MTQSFAQRRIPTFLGIGVLLVSLVIGVLFLNKGLGVFAPRATAQTTPKKIKITNAKDTGFTVSFLTDDSTVGFIKYGTDPTALKLQASDDRDQLSGSVSPYTTHYITVRDLAPNTPYYFTLGTGSQAEYDNNGSPFTIKTTAKGGVPPAAKTVYGSVTTAAGSPATGAMVYVDLTGVGELSALVKDSGSWAVPLSNARTTDGSSYATVQDADIMTITAQGVAVDSVTTVSVPVSQGQPVAAINLGATGTTTNISPASQASTPSATPVVNLSPLSSPVTPLVPATNSLSNLSATQPTGQVVDVKASAAQTVTTLQPTIIGVAPANVSVKIQIHSTQQISTSAQTDSTGSYSINLADLQQKLSPGIHTVTVSYTDPVTHKVVTEKKTFTVQAPSSTPTTDTTLADNSLAAETPINPFAQTSTTGQTSSQTSPQPYGSSNPFSIDNTSPTPTSAPRLAVVASGSALPVTGSTDTTWLLILGGLFLVGAGAWSWKVAIVGND